MVPDTPSEPSPPAREPERAVMLDILRGTALAGILVINITTVADPGGMFGLGRTGPLADLLVWAGLILLVESKFFTLFSFLFGMGFAIQLQRARRRGDRHWVRFLRRLFALGLFGVAHIVLLWAGDILLCYALVGLLLLAFQFASDRWLIRWSVVLLTLPLLAIAAVFLLTVVARFFPEGDAKLREADAELLQDIAKAAPEAQANPTYGEMIEQRLDEYKFVAVLLATRVSTVLAMFLLGMWAGRREVLARPDDHLPLSRWVRRWGLGVGLVLSALVTAQYFLAPPITALTGLFFNQTLVGPILAMGYAAAFVLFVRRVGESRFAPVAAVGRMALTNYLGQSLLCAIVFWKLGFGLVGTVSPLGQVGIAALIYLVQMALSVVWLRYFQYGPMEWLWRAFTYLRFPPFLRTATSGEPHSLARHGGVGDDAERRGRDRAQHEDDQSQFPRRPELPPHQ